MNIHTRRTSWLLAVILLGSPLQAQTAEELDVAALSSSAAQSQPVPDLDQTERRIIELTNQFRADEGLEKLERNSQLQAAAQYLADYMARTNRYGHQADGKTPAQRASEYDYDYCLILENIAYRYSSAGFTVEQLAEGFFNGWKESPQHRKNMLSPDATETGLAVAHSEETGHYFAVQMFGRPRSAAITFRIVNETEELLQYSLDGDADRGAGSGQPSATAEGQPQSPDSTARNRPPYELPPRAIMTHERCRSAQLHFSWMQPGEATPVSGNATVIVRKTSDGQFEIEKMNDTPDRPEEDRQ